MRADVTIHSPCMCVWIHTHTHLCAHAHMHTHMHTHTYTHTLTRYAFYTFGSGDGWVFDTRRDTDTPKDRHTDTNTRIRARYSTCVWNACIYCVGVWEYTRIHGGCMVVYAHLRACTCIRDSFSRTASSYMHVYIHIFTQAAKTV